MPISHPIPEIRLFQNLTVKIQGQSQGWGQSWKLQSGCNILSTHIPFVQCQSPPPIPEIQHFQNLTLKIQGQGHGWRGHLKSQHGSNILLTHIPLIPCQSAISSLRYDFFKFDLDNPRSRSWVRGTLKVTKWVQHPIDSHPFCSMSIGPSIPEIQHFQNLTFKIQRQGQMTMMLHSDRSRQFHRTSNGINPSSGFRDMVSAKSGPSAAWFDKFLAHGQAHMGQMGKWLWQCTPTGLDNTTELRMEKIRQAVTEIWVPQVWQLPAWPLACPPAWTMMTITLQPRGMRGKKFRHSGWKHTQNSSEISSCVITIYQ